MPPALIVSRDERGVRESGGGFECILAAHSHMIAATGLRGAGEEHHHFRREALRDFSGAFEPKCVACDVEEVARLPYAKRKADHVARIDADGPMAGRRGSYQQALRFGAVERARLEWRDANRVAAQTLGARSRGKCGLRAGQDRSAAVVQIVEMMIVAEQHSVDPTDVAYRYSWTGSLAMDDGAMRPLILAWGIEGGICEQAEVAVFDENGGAADQGELKFGFRHVHLLSISAKYTRACRHGILYYCAMAEQKRTGLDWEDIRVFLAIARHGSFSAAGRALGINHATVSRRTQAFERSIGERLFERRPDGYVLTPAGTRILASASRMEVAAEALARGGEDEGPNGLVRINAPPSLTQGFLIRQLARLSLRHQGLDIDLATDVRSVSLERRETDVALRLTRPEDGDVIASHIATFDFGFYGNAACRKRITQGESPVFIGFDELNAHLPEAMWHARHFPKARFSMRSNSQMSQALAAAEGAGLALLPWFVASLYPELELCVLQPEPPSRELWMLTRRSDQKNPAIHLITDYLRKVFEAEKALFSKQSR